MGRAQTDRFLIRSIVVRILILALPGIVRRSNHAQPSFHSTTEV